MLFWTKLAFMVWTKTEY